MRQRAVSHPRSAVAAAPPVRSLVAGLARGLLAALLVACLAPAAVHADEAEPLPPAEAGDPAETPEPQGYLVEGSVLSKRLGRGAAFTFDALVLRPVAALATGAGFALFVPAALFSYPSEGRDGAEEAWRIFVQSQARQVYERPLGDFS